MKNNDVRSRNFSFEKSYKYDISDENKNIVSDIDESEWRQLIINRIINCQYDEVWLIFHDKDVYIEHDNNLDVDVTNNKGLHCHGIIMNGNARTASSIKNSLGIKNDKYNKFVEPIKKDSSAFRYLTHTTDKAMIDKKYRYDIDELYLFIDGKQINDKDKVRSLYTERISSKEKKENNGLNDLISNLSLEISQGVIEKYDALKILEKNYAEKGSYQFFKQNRVFDNAEKAYRNTFINSMIENGRNLVNIYIYGDSNSGKTQFVNRFARYICKRENIKNKNIYNAPSTLENSKTYYMLSGYDMQPITIIDDVDANVFNFSDFNKIFDKHVVPLVRNRNSDKYWFSNKSFIVKYDDPNDYFKKIYSNHLTQNSYYNQNIIKQTMKRVQFEIKITINEIVVFKNFDFINFKEICRFNYSLSERENSKHMDIIYKKLYKIFYL